MAAKIAEELLDTSAELQAGDLSLVVVISKIVYSTVSILKTAPTVLENQKIAEIIYTQ